MPTPTLSYVLPVHNQAHVLERSVQRLRERLREFPGSEVLLIENGSTDDSAALCDSMAAALHRDDVSVRTATSSTGMGHALRRGMHMAVGEIVVLTAADLPFDFSDLDAFLNTSPRPELAIGSKAHPDSHVEVAAGRRLMSGIFRGLRVAVLGLHVRDSQGTIFMGSRLCRRVLSHLVCADFLISTEVVCWSIREGASPVELPVVYPRSQTSTVSPLRDSARMLAGMVALRRRLDAAPTGAAALQEL